MSPNERELEIGGIYHIVNRGVDKRIIFADRQDYSRFTIALECYNSTEKVHLWALLGLSSPGYSQPDVLADNLRQWREKEHTPIVEVLAFCLMPNHYHLLLREITEGGISEYMKKLGSGYTRYFNSRYKRSGALFGSKYKSVSVTSNEKLANVFVYIHTNPMDLSGGGSRDNGVENIEKVRNYIYEYPWSSLGDYTGNPRFPYVVSTKFLTEALGPKSVQQELVDDYLKGQRAFAFGGEALE